MTSNLDEPIEINVPNGGHHPPLYYHVSLKLYYLQTCPGLPDSGDFPTYQSMQCTIKEKEQRKNGAI